MTPDEESGKPASVPGEKAQSESLNSFQIIGVILTGSIGISSKKNRGRDLMAASYSAWLGAIAIFVVFHYVALRGFVYLVKRAAAH